MADPLVFRGSPADLRARLREAVAALAGRAPDPSGEVAVLLRALGVQALSLVKQAYVEKARGGTAEDGITWDKLSRRYVAYGRTHPGLNSKRGKAAAKGRASRPLLTTAQDKTWRGIFASTYRRLRARGSSDEEARKTAAATAWSVVKAQGGKTILGQYGDAPAEIGRNNDTLFNSLSPGDPNNCLDASAGAVTIGSNVEYAEHFAVRRPLWHDNGDDWPEAWKQRLGETLGDALQGVLRRLAEQGR